MDFLEWAKKNTVSWEEFCRQKKVSEISTDFEKASNVIKTAEESKTVPQQQDSLSKLLVKYNNMLGKGLNENMKCVFLQGRIVASMKASNMPWDKLTDCCSVMKGLKGDNKLSQQTLKNYEKFYSFVSKYKRFLRVSTHYSTLLRHEKVITEYFSQNKNEKNYWIDFQSD